MSDLIRPPWTRINEARVSLAAPLGPPDPLRSSVESDPGEPPDVPVEVREQVLREALSDALTYHVADSCPHITEPHRAPFAVLARGELLCVRCIYGGEPWEGPGDSPCTLCGRDGPLISTWTCVSAAPDAMRFAAHVCRDCAAWWPRPEHAGPEPDPHADARSRLNYIHPPVDV
jgi:hypothetical protein